ncbi:MAG: NUDIX domain-containing protein [Gammaproteobacteria bacterium]|nr:NUDIX domain-containing protein [Gammaproteobacteria bacterium]
MDLREQVRASLAVYEPRLSGWEVPGAGSGATVLGDGRFRPAAVLLLLDARAGEERLVLQLRTAHVEHHKGQVSLPGGRRDEEDDSLLATALRETHEEIGVPPDAVELLGRIDDITTGTGYAVSPFVGAVEHTWQGRYRPHPAEVERLLEVPLEHLRSQRSRVRATVTVRERPRSEEAFIFQGALIWGATGRILHNFLDVIGGAVSDGGSGHGA